MNLLEIESQFKLLRRASRALRNLDSSVKNQLLLALSARIRNETSALLQHNKLDLEKLPGSTSNAFRDRLTLTESRIEQICQSLKQVAELPDPVGELVDFKRLKNGLSLKRIRAPLGVIFMIFESRPNVILEAFSLAFKSGNAIALRGGSDSSNTAQFIYQIMRDEIVRANMNCHVFFGINDYDREIVANLLSRGDLIDVTVPRGGDQLIKFVTENAAMPVIKNDRGLCHAYVDSEVDIEMAVRVVANAKTQRPGVCNSLETVLVNEKIASDFLPRLRKACENVGLQWRCDETSFKIFNSTGISSVISSDHAEQICSENSNSKCKITMAQSQDWNTEHLDQILNCKVVEDLTAAIDHIELHGSRHSETILTKNEHHARRFQSEVDAAVVYWNASTRFTDGFELGLGGELGISTQKLHVRGPVGLRELTTPRWIIDGTGQTRD